MGPEHPETIECQELLKTLVADLYEANKAGADEEEGEGLCACHAQESHDQDADELIRECEATLADLKRELGPEHPETIECQEMLDTLLGNHLHEAEESDQDWTDTDGDLDLDDILEPDQVRWLTQTAR